MRRVLLWKQGDRCIVLVYRLLGCVAQNFLIFGRRAFILKRAECEMCFVKIIPSSRNGCFRWHPLTGIIVSPVKTFPFCVSVRINMYTCPKKICLSAKLGDIPYFFIKFAP